MDHATCDLCGKVLLVHENARYEVRIQVYAAYDPMELTHEDLARDSREQLRRLLERLAEMDPQEIEDSVYKEFLFDLCPACQRRYLQRPLPTDAADQPDSPPCA